MKHNEHEVEKMKQIAKEIGADKLTLKSVGFEIIETSQKDLEETKQFLPTKKEHQRYEEGLKRKGKIKNKCIRLWLSSVVNWNGDVVPCCYDPEGIFTFGNVEQESFKKIWLNPKYVNFRQAILKNKKSIKMCANCPGTLFGTALND